MKITMGGVRGSCPVAQSSCMGYGGETTSLLIEGRAGERILVDAGSGLRQLGAGLMESPGEKSAWLFMTHYHLDHIAGLPMLPFIYHPDWRLVIAAPRHGGLAPSEIIARILDRPFWPLQVEDMKAQTAYITLEGAESQSPFVCGGIEVRWCPLRHPGDCTAYRFDEPSTGASVVIATDVEWGLSTPDERAALDALIAEPSPAKLLVMDGQYQDEIIGRFRGWGHSTWQEAVAVAQRGQVRSLWITHHDPSADDQQLDRIQGMLPSACSFARLAREGMSMVLDDRAG